MWWEISATEYKHDNNDEQMPSEVDNDDQLPSKAVRVHPVLSMWEYKSLPNSEHYFEMTEVQM